MSKVTNIATAVRQFLRKNINKQLTSEGTRDHTQTENRLQQHRYFRIDETIKNNKIVVNELVEWVKRENKRGMSTIPNLSEADANHLCDILAQRNVDLYKISNRCIWSDKIGSNVNTPDMYDDRLLKHILSDFAKHVNKRYIATPAGKGLDRKYNEISLYENKCKKENPVSDLCLSTVKKLQDQTKKNKYKSPVQKPLQIESKENTFNTNSIDNKKTNQKVFIKSPEDIASSSNQMIKLCRKRNVDAKKDAMLNPTERFDEMNMEIDIPSNASSATARYIEDKKDKSKSELITGVNFL